MDPRLIRYYNRELQHVREMGAEFAQEFPKIAGRLGLEGFECADPYVERLLEGFAFLTARIQLKLDAEFPRFTQHLLEMLYPHYLAPVPSTAIVQLQPNPQEGSLAAGYVVPRGTALKSQVGRGDKTACEYRTAHETVLWPLQISDARYYESPAAIAAAGFPDSRARAAVKLTLATTAGVRLNQLTLDRLPIWLTGPDEQPKRLYEQIFANGLGALVRTKSAHHKLATTALDASCLRRVGFSDEEALIPYSGRSFSGYRLLQEYFACPERFLFAEIAGLRAALARCDGTQFELVILFDQSVPALVNAIDAANFKLFCTPAINLFARRADRIHLDAGRTEYQIVPDRLRPIDFEVHSVSAVDGYGNSSEPEQHFLPFYGGDERHWHDRHSAFYTLRREPRLLSSRARAQGARASYVGSEVFVSLVDARELPYGSSLRQLAIETLCTNRDLPLTMPVGKGRTDFTLDSGAPVDAVRCVAGPKKPRAAAAYGESAWRLISHLSQNYLSLLESDEHEGASALREMLLLYADDHDSTAQRQIEGVKRIAARPVVRRLPLPGPITFGRGLSIELSCDDAAFEGTGAFLLGAVLQEFFARQVSINAFTETRLDTLQRGPVARWPAQLGRRPLL
jgi:type VI secretion system protein ImpG